MGDILAELPFTTVSYSHVLNSPGSFSGTMALQQPEPLKSVLKAALMLGRNTLYVERNGVIMWAGIPWTRNVDFDANTYTINAEGWHSYFRHRHITETVEFILADQIHIARDLIDWAQAQPGGDIGVQTSMVAHTAVWRARTYLANERKNVGEAVEELAALENGFDFRYESAWAGDVINTNFRTFYPATGRATDIVFEIGTQISTAGAICDGTTLATHVDAIGGIPEDSETPLIASVSDTLRLAEMPRLDDVVSFTDVIVPPTLTAHANARLKRGAECILIPSITLESTMVPPIGSYREGDRVTVRADIGLETIEGMFRITEFSVNVGENGDETPALSFANVDVF